MEISKRLIHSTSTTFFKLDPNYKLKCGLEIHTQLKTNYKLFSLSPTSFNSRPNSKISYFDCGLPGTFPKLNPEALYLALKTAVALNSEVQSISSFDRKHYFYPDQPLGYQITQYYHPLAKNGYLELTNDFDDILEPSKVINIERIQIEQDTGKINYNHFDKMIKIDLNRNNIPLIELVTRPDFENFSQIKSFIKKYQTLVKYLNVCSGDLETGAIRVDVNISVNDNSRVEIKNLGSTGEIHDALKFEYQRQIDSIKQNQVINQETRGWNGSETIKLRSKEDAFDYRYVPDSELPKINLSSDIEIQVKQTLPDLPDLILKKLHDRPYNLELKYAKFLVDNPRLLDYYYRLFDIVVNKNKKNYKSVNNWLFHELLGSFNKLKVKLDLNLIPPERLSELILLVVNDNITLSSARILLNELIRNINNIGHSINELIQIYDLQKPNDISTEELSDAIEEVCIDIINSNPTVVDKIRKGKKNSIKYLIGLAMRETQGKVNSKLVEQKFNELINL